MRTDDRYIIHKCLSGDSAAFGILVDKYKASIYALAYSKLRNFHDAEDITQEAFIKAYRNLRTLRYWDDFPAWLYSITSNLCKNWIRSQSTRPDRDFVADQSPDLLTRLSMNSYRDSMTRESVHEALNSLPEIYRQVLTLYYFSGMSIREIGRFLRIPPNTIAQRLRRARARMKQEMIAMMSESFEERKLQADFTFRIVEAVKRIKIQPTPRTAGLPWGLSLAAGVIVAVLGIGPYLRLDKPVIIPKDLPLSSEMKVLKVSDVPLNPLEKPQTVITSDQQLMVKNKEPSILQKAPLLASKGSGVELTARDVREGDYLGERVFIYGDYAIAGAPRADSEKGVAYIFKYDGTTWREQETLIAKDSAEGDRFGWSIAITDRYAIVSAPYDDDMGEDTGSVYIFRFDGVSWTEETKLRPHGQTIKWCAFGFSVSVSGDYLIVGSPYESWAGGAVYIFNCGNGKWVEQAKLISSDWAQQDRFGYAVSISGDHAIAGAWWHNSKKGSAYIFKRDSNTWKEQAVLEADDGEANDYFGYCVSISGNYAIVGAENDRDKGDYSGSAYIFYNDGTSWKQQAKLVSSDLAEGDGFGIAVHISGNYALVGAPCKKGDAGVVYSFMRHGTSWEERARLSIDDESPNLFGYSISTSGDNVIIGAPKHNNTVGCAYIYSCKKDLSLSVNPPSHTNTTLGGVKNRLRSNVNIPDSETEPSTTRESCLLQNFPNPFNPETWIPFSLSETEHVVIRIYNPTGQLVRTLDLGQKASGTYLSKEKAAYWNGRNEEGEMVASDVYFYIMEAGKSATDLRKMVIVR